MFGLLQVCDRVGDDMSSVFMGMLAGLGLSTTICVRAQGDRGICLVRQAIRSLRCKCSKQLHLYSSYTQCYIRFARNKTAVKQMSEKTMGASLPQS